MSEGQEDKPEDGRRPGSGDGGVRGNSKPAITHEQVAQMTPEEINREWERVQKALRGGP